MANNIIDHFNQYFEIVPAISDDLKNEVYKLRYEVYCIENNFESPSQFSDQMESDAYDQYSVHYLIRHKKSGFYAATTRLILPNADNPEKLFPLEVNCEINNFAVIKPINRKHLGEISRFCVSKAFKKRKNETLIPATIDSNRQNDFTVIEQRSFPFLGLALIGCIVKASYENEIQYIYATSEPSWLRFVSSVGIYLIKIGPLVDFHGDRWPTVIKVTDMLDSVAKKDMDIWNLLTNKGCFLQAGPIAEKQITSLPPYKSSRN